VRSRRCLLWAHCVFTPRMRRINQASVSAGWRRRSLCRGVRCTDLCRREVFSSNEVFSITTSRGISITTVTRPISDFWSPEDEHNDVSEYESLIIISLNVVLPKLPDNHEHTHSHCPPESWWQSDRSTCKLFIMKRETESYREDLHRSVGVMKD
jgi:hypothetical protein